MLLLVIGATHGLIEGIEKQEGKCAYISWYVPIIDVLINQSIQYLHFHCKQ